MIELAGKIFDELTVHTTIEEEIFYPEVHDTTDDVSDTVDEGVQEHHVVKVLMEELGQIEGGSDEWVAKMTVLIENVEHHAEEEEKELFPPLRRPLADELEKMGTRLEARKAELGAPGARRQDRPDQGRAPQPGPGPGDPRAVQHEPGRAGRHRRPRMTRDWNRLASRDPDVEHAS